MNHSARRINTLANAIGADHYLEIGVDLGETFLDVEIMYKTAVDPAFRFDTSTFATAFTRFQATDSDSFFASDSIGRSLPYDIVFIDGMHRFEQVLRDFNNTILRTHGNSIILIDDTFPEDVYSAIPASSDALSFRHAAGGASTSWHGDVFKLVFHIHDFWPTLNYCTIFGSGNPQTLVWRSGKNTRRLPAFDNAEATARLNYFDLNRHLYMLNPCSEDEALDTFINEVAS